MVIMYVTALIEKIMNWVIHQKIVFRVVLNVTL